MGDITEMARYVTTDRHEQEVERRDGYERRSEKRMQDIELRHLQLRETVVGVNGDNGLASELKLVAHITSWHTKIIYSMVGSIGTIVVAGVCAVVVKALTS